MLRCLANREGHFHFTNPVFSYYWIKGSSYERRCQLDKVRHPHGLCPFLNRTFLSNSCIRLWCELLEKLLMLLYQKLLVLLLLLLHHHHHILDQSDKMHLVSLK